MNINYYYQIYLECYKNKNIFKKIINNNSEFDSIYNEVLKYK